MIFRALRRALSRLRKGKKHNPTAERCQETTPREKGVDPSRQRSNNNDTTRSLLLFTEVPSPIIMEILSRLPVRDVVRARCVSKTWSALVADPYFAQLHLSRAPPSYTHIALFQIPRITRFVLANVESDESRDYFVDFKQLNPRFTLTGYNLELKTSCDGLLCLVGPKANDRDVVYVCNPVLGEYTTLPEIEYKRYKRFILGFGVTRGDYKVLQGVRDLDSGNSVLQVHRLGTRSWKKLQDIQTPYSRFEGLRPGTFLHGSLHWISGMPADGQVWLYEFLSFDLQSEQIEPFPGPNLPLGMSYRSSLRVSGGLLSLILSPLNSWDIELWVMKQYGVKESWTKTYTISMRDPFWGAHKWIYRVYHLLDCGSRGGDVLGKDVFVVASMFDGTIWIVRGNKRESGRVSMPGKENLVVYHFEGESVQETYSYFIYEEDRSKFPGDTAASLVSLRNIVGEDDLITV